MAAWKQLHLNQWLAKTWHKRTWKKKWIFTLKSKSFNFKPVFILAASNIVEFLISFSVSFSNNLNVLMVFTNQRIIFSSTTTHLLMFYLFSLSLAHAISTPDCTWYLLYALSYPILAQFVCFTYVWCLIECSFACLIGRSSLRNCDKCIFFLFSQ